MMLQMMKDVIMILNELEWNYSSIIMQQTLNIISMLKVIPVNLLKVYLNFYILLPTIVKPIQKLQTRVLRIMKNLKSTKLPASISPNKDTVSVMTKRNITPNSTTILSNK